MGYPIIDKNRNWFIDSGCNLRQPFICKANIAKIEPVPPRDDRGDLLPCPNEWESSSSNGMGNWCIKAFARDYSWYEADSYCKANFGSRLVSIHSDHFNDRVNILTTSGALEWRKTTMSYHNIKVKSIFMNRLIPEGGSKQDQYWIGLSRNEDGGMTWVDGSPTTYTNWAQNEPSYTWDGEVEDCTQVYNTGNLV